MDAVRRDEDGVLRVHSYAHNEPSAELVWLDEVHEWPLTEAEVEGRGVVPVFTEPHDSGALFAHGYTLPLGLSADDIGEGGLDNHVLGDE